MNVTRATRDRARRIGTTGLLTATAIATLGGTAAYAASGTDGERSLPDSPVETADWAEASADPAVTAAYAKFLLAAAQADEQQAALDGAKADVAKARKTPGRDDDRQARAALAQARKGLGGARLHAAQLKDAWDVAISDRLAALEATHGGTPSGGPAGPSGPSDGVFAGKVSHRNPFGDIQVTLTLSGGKVTNCTASYPTENQSGTINRNAIPALCAEVISAQSAAIGAVGGASYTSPAFKDSLADAVRKAGL